MPNSADSSCNPSTLFQEIDAARTIGQLRVVGVRIIEMIKPSISSGADTKNIVLLISSLNDAITKRLIELLDSSEGIRLPEGATFLVLGSEGRGEQTLRTDQDSAIVYIDDLEPDKLGDIRSFAARIVVALDEIGVPPCPGNIMASNPQWCHSMTEWEELLDQWISAPTPENMLNFGMIQDLRPLHGDEDLGMKLRDYIRRAVHLHTIFFPNMAEHVVRFPPPFTMFGRIRVEQKGDHKGEVDLKKAGIFAISAGASLLSLEAGMVGGNTWEKLEFLWEKGIVTRNDFTCIEETFTFMTRLRLKRQLQQLSADGIPTNCVDLRLMTGEELDQFRQSLKGVKTFLWIFRNHYLLDLFSI